MNHALLASFVLNCTLLGVMLSFVVHALRRRAHPVKTRSTRRIPRLYDDLLVSADYVSGTERPLDPEDRQQLQRDVERGRRARELMEDMKPELKNAYRNMLVEFKGLAESATGKDKLYVMLGRLASYVELESGWGELVTRGEEAFEQMAEADEEMQRFRLTA